MSRFMRIGMVGGLDRNAATLQDIAEAHGHHLELHTGVVGSAASSAGLRALVARSQLVVVLTDVNSHNAVRAARREARLRQRPIKILRRMGISQFSALLEDLDAREAA